MSKNKMWGGRFAQSPSKLMEKINQSISFDRKLYKYDIEASIAHVEMLKKTSILTKKEAENIKNGLKQIKREIEEGSFLFRKDLEDIHMNIENRLGEIIGDDAGKLHTARSRNDQVVTDFKLYIRDAYDELEEILKELQKVLIEKSEENINVIMPGFTHLQIAQPVSFAHHLMAYFEMIKRDRSRLKDNKKRMNESPLGCAALAGTSFPIDRFFTAKILNFDIPCANSLDGVSDRDFVIDFLSFISILSVHLSRLCEEIIIWMSSGFEFVKLSDLFTSGSSIMPQKKNPDAAELIRGKTSKNIASLFHLLTLMKALPLTYFKDMQEDKESTFETFENIKLSLLVTKDMIQDLTVNKKNMEKMASSNFSTATDLADWLVRVHKMPFRKAHHITGEIVKLAEDNNCQLHEIKIEEMQEIERLISKDIYNVLNIKNSIKSRKSFGGTSFENIKKAIEVAKDSIN